MDSDFSLPSFAKINLLLRILGKRPDGFHELFTVFQSVSLHDRIRFARAKEIKLTCTSNRIPTDERNIIFKAALALKTKFGYSEGAELRLEKRIPSPGGLGGGSSNAAVALLGLNRLWQLDASIEKLQTIASELGSDVPFFLYGGTAIGIGRGDKLEAIDDIEESAILIVTPKVRVSTARAFSRIEAPTLTKEDVERILRVCRLEAESLLPRQSTLINDFEQSVFNAHPEVLRVKSTLLELGAVNAAMSGSGASVFAIFDKTETRQAAIKALDHESTWRKFAVATISRSEYREALRC
ncbi:MAG: 4-(cytidine 5'-diphospho)-2-C-methyl-D-erythritol kinase [Pyrinomonadaceae bacterium]|nr:4-(cytidine 5'-diphospho)-2-C-methyl-D-erythritol kinase [Pyrinomonadaceae bacterium]MBP6214006.1 4-(cytidine 5'-diphospho)-2-C-methyl-D-erythritol kinase [Pyrinomonadaceae bacterium]